MGIDGKTPVMVRSKHVMAHDRNLAALADSPGAEVGDTIFCSKELKF